MLLLLLPGPRDYASVSTQLEFDQDNQRQCVEIAIENDNDIEDTEVFSVFLMSPDGNVRITTNNATVQIADNSGKLLSEMYASYVAMKYILCSLFVNLCVYLHKLCICIFTFRCIELASPIKIIDDYAYLQISAV